MACTCRGGVHPCKLRTARAFWFWWHRMEIARKTAIIALSFTGISGLIGGIPLILRPDGSVMSLPVSLLQYSPFPSYLIPGIILFLAVGVLGCTALWLTLQRQPNYPTWVAAAGCVLVGWIVVEMLLLRLVMWVQSLYLAVAILQIVSGITLVRERTLVSH